MYNKGITKCSVLVWGLIGFRSRNGQTVTTYPNILASLTRSDGKDIWAGRAAS